MTASFQSDGGFNDQHLRTTKGEVLVQQHYPHEDRSLTI